MTSTKTSGNVWKKEPSAAQLFACAMQKTSFKEAFLFDLKKGSAGMLFWGWLQTLKLCVSGSYMSRRRQTLIARNSVQPLFRNYTKSIVKLDPIYTHPIDHHQISSISYPYQCLFTPSVQKSMGREKNKYAGTHDLPIWQCSFFQDIVKKIKIRVEII